MSDILREDGALRLSLKYFNGDQMAADIFVKKYALRDKTGQIFESNPAMMHRRLAKEFARIESKYANPLSYDEIFQLFDGFRRVIPQGSPMSGIGNPYSIQSLSNCFVIEGAYDSYASINRTDDEMTAIMKRRGGVGHDVSRIRPKNMAVSNAAGSTDGIAIFLDQFSDSTRRVAQGGRRGALMLTIDIRHPEIETFINIKRDKTRVTGANMSIRMTDAFMQAVKDDADFTLQWPCEVPVAEAKVTRVVRAKEIWNQVIDAAWDNAEPGVLFWDTVKKWTPSDAYTSLGYGSISTNPCLTADTRIAVADGRGFVTIGKLAESGLDVPVYSRNNKTGKIVVRTMRRPRKTGENVPVYKVTIEGGHTFRATANHKMILRDGSRKRIDELLSGDQLWTAHRVAGKFNEALPGYDATQSQNYWWLKSCENKSWKSEHRMIWESVNGNVPNGHVLHHIDFDAKNNDVTNLRCMTKKAHDEFHAEQIRGDKNPYHRMTDDWKMKFATHEGAQNGRAYDVTNEQLHQHFVVLTKSIGRRMSDGDWVAYAKANGLPQFLNDWRLGGRSFYDIGCEVAKECNVLDHLIDIDPRTARIFVEAELQGYECKIEDGYVEVKRTCEWCKDSFWNFYDLREVAFCGKSCSLKYANSKSDVKAERVIANNKTAKAKADANLKGQLDTFTSLRFTLNRDPFFKEWAEECKKLDIPSRLGTKHGIKAWSDLKDQAQTHNHRVVSVELDGCEDVFNGTVDEEHVLCFGVGQEKLDRFSNNSEIIIASEQCGEIVLSAYDACRLVLVNVLTYVKNQFLPSAFFDFDEFASDVVKAQRLMDDLVDLEIEAIDRIIEKVKSDPEPEEEKIRELTLWQKVRAANVNARRTGLGITALGDAIASLGVKYGSEDSIAFTEAVYSQLAISAHQSSVKLAEERGAFPIHSHKLEKGHPFFERLRNASNADVNAMYDKFGRRNICLTTTAPAGSVSTQTQTTSGIEPTIFLDYVRSRKVNPNDTEARVDRVDALGDKWQEYRVYHHGVAKWMEATGETDVTKSPYFGATCNEIDWVASVDVQAAAQKWVEHSISKTCNLPRDVSKQVVSDCYMRAWELVCKVFTVYREGSRDAVIVDASKEKKAEKETITENHAPKRAKELQCEIHHVKVTGESWTILVGLSDQGKPYEIFGGLTSLIEIPKKIKFGRLAKSSRQNGITTYNLVMGAGDDELKIKDVVSVFDNKTQGAFTRTISLALRHGVPLQFICEQLVKDKHSDMQSFSRVISRVLKTYIVDGTKAGQSICESCQANGTLVYVEKCISCVNCGWSKCS